MKIKFSYPSLSLEKHFFLGTWLQKTRVNPDATRTGDQLKDQMEPVWFVGGNFFWIFNSNYTLSHKALKWKHIQGEMVNLKSPKFWNSIRADSLVELGQITDLLVKQKPRGWCCGKLSFQKTIGPSSRTFLQLWIWEWGWLPFSFVLSH